MYILLSWRRESVSDNRLESPGPDVELAKKNLLQRLKNYLWGEDPGVKIAYFLSIFVSGDQMWKCGIKMWSLTMEFKEI